MAKPRKSLLLSVLALLTMIASILLGYARALISILGVSIGIMYIIWGLLRINFMLYGLRPYYEPTKSPEVLPKVSLILPAKHEPLIGRTIEVFLNHTDYPKEKKEILPVVDDEETARIAIWYAQKYPEQVKPLYRTDVRVATKPSALNDAFAFTTGDVIGIVDSEDIPDRDVLKKVIAAIYGDGYESVQVMLGVSNGKDSWITRMFQIEYEAWYGVLQNGRFHLGSYVPLGGTGCYLTRRAVAEVGAWDPLNVAEDAELAIRLMLTGKKTALIKAMHWEEMPTKARDWLRQRARWFKGWLQSLSKYFFIFLSYHTIKRVGLLKVLGTLIQLFSPLVIVGNFIAYSLTAVWIVTDVLRLVYAGLMADLLPWWLIIPLIFNLVYFSELMVSSYKTKNLRKNLGWLLPMFILYYNGLMTLGALKALYEYLVRPVYWAKTEHVGLGVRWTALK